MPSLRVAQIIEATTGGVRRHLTDLVTHLAGPDFAIHVFCSTRRDPHFRADIERMRQAGAEVTVVDMRREIAPGPDWRAYRELTRLLRDGDFHVVHAHSSKAGVLGRRAAKSAGAPAVVYTPHCFPFEMRAAAPTRWFYRQIERRMAGDTNRIIAVCAQEREAALRSRICAPEKIAVIENGLDLEAFDRAQEPAPERQELGLREEDVVIGTMGRLTRQKGQEHLVRALPAILGEQPAARVLLVGEGELRPRLEGLAWELGLSDRVVFAGHREDAAACYQVMDIFVLPSLWEACPYAILEAMAAQTAVVASAVGGCRDIVEDRVSGVLVPPGEPRAIANAVLSILRNPERLAALGEAGRRRVEEHFALARMVERTAELYRELVREKVAA
ncbi:MAG: glycosyltransferase family 4 protein [Armatimonadota bacterium]